MNGTMIERKGSRGWRGAFAAAALLGAVQSAPVHAQASITPVQDLSFGQLTPGIPMHITPDDVVHRAEFRVDGTGNYTLQFILPTVLRSTTTTATIPLSVSATDGEITKKNKTSTFDPRVGTSIKLTPGQNSADVMIGATASPVSGQLAGTYRATITLYYIQSGT